MRQVIFFTISLSVIRLQSSSHVPQCNGKMCVASTKTSKASLTRSSFRKTTPYLHTENKYDVWKKIHGYRKEHRLSCHLQIKSKSIQFPGFVLLTKFYSKLTKSLILHLAFL